jgi:glycosyltransferase involved in cell wall biosynthesis
LQAYDAIRERDARIICVSDELATRVAGNGPVVILPNGIDEQWWQLRPEPPVELQGLPRPIISYVGTIEGRTDIGLIEKLAGEKAIGSIAFIGPVGDKEVGDALTRIPKVALCGNMMREGVVGSIMHSDVCIIPHIVSPFTRAMSPIKLYEYLAGGKPVVTTDLPPVKKISERVLVASGDNFPRAVFKALGMPPQAEEARLEFVRSNSWQVRLERMLQVMLADDTKWWQS